MGLVFIFFVCATFNLLCDPPWWATIGLFVVMYYQYSISCGLSDEMEELINAR